MNKKIIIMTASIGHGHNKVALTIKKSLLKEGKNLEIKIVDFIEIMESLFGQIVLSAYFKIIDNFPSWYHYIYSITSKMNKGTRVKDLFAHKYKRKVHNIIKEFNPDAIIFTNPFILMIVSYLKKNGMVNAYTAAVMTDYSSHNIWIDSSIDKYFVGSKELKDELRSIGIKEYNIEVSGIPVDDKFYLEPSKEEIIKNLGLKDNLKTILIMGGGLGLGCIEEVLDNISLVQYPLQTIVVTGTNSILKENIENKANKYRHHMKVLGFVDNIHELMHCSDLLISKSGGVTVTEAIVKELPMLIIDPIPGQEMENAEYLESKGIGILANNSNEVKRTVEDLLFENNNLISEMKNKCKEVAVENSSFKIVKIILNDIDIYEKTSII